MVRVDKFLEIHLCVDQYLSVEKVIPERRPPPKCANARTPRPASLREAENILQKSRDKSPGAAAKQRISPGPPANRLDRCTQPGPDDPFRGESLSVQPVRRRSFDHWCELSKTDVCYSKSGVGESSPVWVR